MTTLNLNDLINPSLEDAIDDLKDQLRVCGDPTETARLRRRLDDLELREAERMKAIGQAKAEHVAKLAEGERRNAAAKARWLRARRALKSEVSVSDEDAVDHAMAKLTSAAKVELAFRTICDRKLHPVHSTALLAAFVDEVSAAQPELAPHLKGLELPAFAPNVAALDYDLPPYQPPPPPPPVWPEHEAGYLAVASQQMIESAIRDGHVLSHQDPISWVVQATGPLNQWGNARSAADVLASVRRGAKLAWLPSAKRVQPPAVDGGRWVEHPAGGSMILELVEAVEVSS